MQIFVKFQGKSYTVDVEADTTVAVLREKVAAKLKAAANVDLPPERVMVRAPKGLLTEGTVGSNDIRSDQTLEIGVQVVATGDAGVDNVLARDLKTLSAQPKIFVFVGIGSYDHGHGEASIRRQQCPAALPGICEEAGLTLRVLLVDEGFAAEHGSDQIYDLGDGWELVKPAADDPPGKVRRYRRGTVQVAVYATRVTAEEYRVASLTPDETEGVLPARTLAGLDLLGRAAALDGNGGVLVAGNFYSESVAAYCAVGDAGVLRALGAPYIRR